METDDTKTDYEELLAIAGIIVVVAAVGLYLLGVIFS